MCVIENEDIRTPKLPPNSNNKEKNSEIENIPKLRMHEKNFKVMNDSKKKLALKTIRKIHSNNLLKKFNMFLKIEWGF
jgi:hypothetical protein